jgi:hypothetical protein
MVMLVMIIPGVLLYISGSTYGERCFRSLLFLQALNKYILHILLAENPYPQGITRWFTAHSYPHSVRAVLKKTKLV